MSRNGQNTATENENVFQVVPCPCGAPCDVERHDRVVLLGLRVRLRRQDGPPDSRLKGVQTRPGKIIMYLNCISSSHNTVETAYKVTVYKVKLVIK